MKTRTRSERGQAHCVAGLVALALFFSCGGDDEPLEIAKEYPAPDEEVVTQQLIDLSKATLLARHPTGSTLRFNQPRHVGCVRGDFIVEPDLPSELQVGLFASTRTFPTWIRFANASAEPDTAKDFRGMSIKLMEVEGPKLQGAGDTHDFILNSHPVLFVGTADDFRKFADYSLNSNPALFFLNPLDPHLKEFRIVRAGRQNHASHLAIPYWSTTPYLFGAGRAIKYAAKPCSQATVQLPKQLTDGYLRDAMRGQLASGGACFDFMVQFQTDAETMPIEDATVEWDETISPFRTVAKIRIPSQSFESSAQMEFCESLAFNPWRSYPEHRPLGGLNRARKDLYRELAEFRHKRNGVPYTEPTAGLTF